MGEELSRAFTFMREDRQALGKLLICFIGMVVPLIGWIPVLGYCVTLFRNCIEEKEDDRVLPTWEEFGNYFFKGVSLAAGLALYVIVMIVVVGGVSIVSVLPAGAVMGEGMGMSIVSTAVFFVVSFLSFAVLGSVCSWFSQTLEVSSCFKFYDVGSRIFGLGVPYYALCAASACVSAVGFFLYSSIGGAVGWAVMCCLFTYALIACTYGSARIVNDIYHPVLTDPTDIHIDLDSVPSSTEDAMAGTDEYGNDKHVARSASHWATHRPDTSLTWSTDSDKAIEE